MGVVGKSKIRRGQNWHCLQYIKLFCFRFWRRETSGNIVGIWQAESAGKLCDVSCFDGKQTEFTFVKRCVRGSTSIELQSMIDVAEFYSLVCKATRTQYQQRRWIVLKRESTMSFKKTSQTIIYFLFLYLNCMVICWLRCDFFKVVFIGKFNLINF